MRYRFRYGDCKVIIKSRSKVTYGNRQNHVEISRPFAGWAPWIVLGDGFGVLLASHVNGKVLTTIFASGVLLMSLNFLLPRIGGKVLTQDMPTGMLRVGIAGGLGIFSSLLGIGGGTIAIMVMTLCGRSIHRAVGTASGVGTLIAVPSAIGFAIIGLQTPGLPWGSLGYVNLPATLAIASMSILTAPLGVAAAHSMPAGLLQRVFGIYLVIISMVMFHSSLKG
ncbi:sulfite exporter TauE/SafE family protein [Sphingobium chungbukense]|uniref:sulfite exporter TauE/SafE family protein n=1 Tax=Sphingobium chungbukense TaxID=56193 RepID=UPI000A061630|nr:sulfite exporter TauE/SafE family protein [Sphingobium chungbukense]